MIPTSIEISAFGPYPDVVKIDFEQFQNVGMFLVSGKTGSGKTMIFDAIMFALYGTTSGSLRKADQLRCDHSDEKTATFVELSFKLRDKTYLIKRNPKYTLKGKKTPKNHHVTLTIDNAKIIEGVKEVDGAIIDLLGVDANQFKQIAMIAQGEFSKVIHATSGDREKILRTLFSTHHYVSMENKLRDKVRQLDEEVLVYKGKRDVYLNNLSEDFNLEENDNQLKDALKMLSTVQSKRDEHLTKLGVANNINADIQMYQTLLLDKSKLDASKNEFDILDKQINDLIKCKDIYPNFIQLEQAKDKLNTNKNKKDEEVVKYNTLKEQFEDISKRYLLIDQSKVSIDSLNIEMQKQNNQINTYNDYSKCISLVESNETLLEQLIQKKSELTLLLEQSILKLETLKKRKDGLSNLEDTYKLNQEKVLKLNKHIDQLQKLNNINVVIDDFVIKVNILKDKFEIHSNLFLESQNSASLLHTTYLNNQAGIIASKLTSGEPCPVCGSTNHPKLASCGNDISLSDVELANEQVNVLREQRDKVYNDLMAKQAEIQKQNALAKQLMETIGTDVTIELLNKQLSDIRVIQNEIELQIKSLNVDEFVKVEDACVLLKNSLQDIDNSITEKQNIISNTKGKLVAFKGYESIDIEQLQKDYELNKFNLEQLKSDVKFVEEKYIELNGACVSLKTSIELLSETIVQLQLEVDKLNINLNDQLNKHGILLESFNNSFDKFDILDQLIVKLNTYNQSKLDVESKLSVLKDKVADLSLQDITVLNNELESIELELKQKQIVVDCFKESIEQYKQNKDRLDKLELEYKSVLDELLIYSDLKDMITGKNKQNLSFERFVLASYFEQILDFANVFLNKMTQGRYVLYRRIEKTSGVGKQGLELDVFDVETGTLREVTSLSGGESFKAALSLALGMSEMIQSSSGGIRIQTVFIDEGFGTLDSESLDQAIQVLMEVQGSDKLVGIISHVEELKTRISNQIRIERNSNVSRIEVLQN